MKMKSILVSMFALAALASCNNDDDIANNGSPQGTPGETAYISLSVVTPTALTRANQSKPGEGAENIINAAQAVFFDGQNKIVTVESIGSMTSGDKTTAFQINADSERLLFVSGAPTALKSLLVVGNTFNQVNAALTASVSDFTASKGFTLVNDSALIDIRENKKASAADALNAAASVKIDRLVAKVQVKEKDGGAESENGSFEFTGWALSITNRTTFPLSERIPYANSTTTALKGIYRIDNNNWKSESITPSFINENFYVLTDDSVATGFTWTDKDKTQYCLENTMSATEQKKGVSTKVVIKGIYTPNTSKSGNLTKGDDYFKYAGDYYTYAELKSAYDKYKAEHLTAGMTDADGIWKDADALVDSISGGTTKTFDDVAINADWFNGKSAGVEAKGAAIRYYEKSVCYYEATIMHDAGVATPMALGRWGVVRNNWYELTVNTISGAGTPWIPDPTNPDPTDPSKPDDPDDKVDQYIAVTVTVNPWTFWQQGVEL